MATIMNITKTIKINTPYCPAVVASVGAVVTIVPVVAVVAVAAAVAVVVGTAVAVVVGAAVAAVVGAAVGAAVVEDIYNIYTQIIHPANWYYCNISFHFYICPRLAHILPDIR